MSAEDLFSHLFGGGGGGGFGIEKSGLMFQVVVEVVKEVLEKERTWYMTLI